MSLFVNNSLDERVWRLFLESNAITKYDYDGYYAGAAVVGGGVVKRPFGYSKGSSGIGGKVITYNQIDLAKLFLNIAPEIGVYNPTTTLALVPALAAKYGIPFTTDDFVSAVVNPVTLPATITLTASSTSKYFTGSVSVLVKTAGVNLADLITSRLLSVLVDPVTKYSGYLSAELLSYGADCTPVTLTEQNALLSLGTGAYYPYNLNGELWQGILSRATGKTWTSSGAYGTTGLTCIYNGPTSGYTTSDQSFERVLVLAPNVPTYTNACKGYLYLHYNKIF